MVAKVGGYYGSNFPGFWGVTQGDLLFTNIFNVVVDAVVRHWVEVMVESVDKKSGRGKEDRQQNSLF